MAVCAQNRSEAAVSARGLLILGLAVVLGGCSTQQPLPWQAGARDALQRYTQNYLRGETRLAARDLAEARAHTGATGRLDLVARTEVIRCALGVAALDFEACEAFEPLRQSAAVADRAYADFLSGDWQALDAGALPERYRALARTRDAGAQNRAAMAIEDPLSRLVASGTLLRRARLSPEGLAAAVETASSQGYRRPLLAYLEVQAQLAEEGGDAAALEHIRRRIELVYRSLPESQ